MNGLSDVLTRLGKVEDHLGNVRTDLSSIKTQMEHVATKGWIMTSTIGVLVALVLSMAGGYMYIAKEVLPLLTKVAGH